MTRQTATARRAEDLLGMPVVATAPVAGGDICTAHRLKLSDGRAVLIKTLAHPPEGFFAAEARGLRRLAEARADGGVAVPEVLAHDDECLVLRWVEPGKPTVEAAADFGRALAATHAAGRDAAYGFDEGGFIGRLPMPNGSLDGWPEFYARRRLLPYLEAARRRGSIGPEDAAAVESLAGRIGDLVPDEPPALLHGDLWNGNVLWGHNGTVHLVDPAVYVGHREMDLAMLALFGLPQLPRVMEAYQEVSPLDDDWEDRLGLHQLFPLLVHAVLFGGGYGARAGAVAARY